MIVISDGDGGFDSHSLPPHPTSSPGRDCFHQQAKSVIEALRSRIFTFEVTEANYHEVQIHLKWEEYDIAIPLHVARQLAEATDQLVEHVGPLANKPVRSDNEVIGDVG